MTGNQPAGDAKLAARARLQQLTPQQRAALAARLKASPPARAMHEEDFHLDHVMSADETMVKSNYRKFYDEVSSQLDNDIYGAASFFLNYGYVADGSPERAVVPLPEHYINRNSLKLVLELIGAVPVTGRDALDVGCGRGGTAHVLNSFYAPASVTGLDLSPVAVEFCNRTHGDATTRFVEGDSERLPFAAGIFDIVTNVESSHSYPNVHRFYAEVARVLRPGGHFLYTDALSHGQFTTARGLFDQMGFSLLRDDDITANVLRSCDEVAAARVGAFSAGNNADLMRNFLATPGSDVYRDLESGRWAYRILHFGKPSA